MSIRVLKNPTPGFGRKERCDLIYFLELLTIGKAHDPKIEGFHVL
jgi:hypothetical protein